MNLIRNEIRDISILKKFNEIFPELQHLNLYNNNITSIDCLKGIILSKLKTLSFSKNEIERINVLENCYFPDLDDLDLSGNKISDISIIEYIKFPKLNFIDLRHNKIYSIKPALFINKQNLPCLNNLRFCRNSFIDSQKDVIDELCKLGVRTDVL